MKYYIMLLFTSISFTAFSQSIRSNTSNVNSWFNYTGDHKISNKISIHIEAQVRRNNIVKNWQQLLLRPAINYHINSNVMLTAGYCFVETYPYGDFPIKRNLPEHRFYEQVQLNNTLKKIEWVSRFRLEQRYNYTADYNLFTNQYKVGLPVYTNRFRLLNRFSFPFKGKSIIDNIFYFTVFDEFFINFGKNVSLNIFDQNRAFVGVGYKLPKYGKLEIGFLEQTLVKPDGGKIENNHTISCNFISSLDFYKKK